MSYKKITKQKLDIRKSNFDDLKNQFHAIISNTHEYDQSGRASVVGITRKEFVFNDDSFLSITEYYTKDGYISHYNYDWYAKDGKVIKLYHSEPHSDKRYQTETEPYHIHRLNFADKKIREPNYDTRDLYSILEEIADKIE